jgi:DNA polymerase-3 subunit gamma/tau
MSYIVFARKYRPQTFDDVIGQSHITTTLKNAIAASRVAHAYIFAGPRGVGKTTTARIFAKALNCEKGPTATPCNVCASCKEITQGSSLDILEIDGASNRGIDEIRSLRENVKFAPSKGRSKVYIIDEIHMLTPEAFNALLKTLEEPPPHVTFIFATTSAYKVPPTILSRCQRFDFRRIASKEILQSLKSIVKDEHIDVKEEALGIIAKYGDGSMRDAQVVLDQIISFSKGKVTIDDVTKILGIVDTDILFNLSGAIKGRDSRLALMTIDRLVDEGKDVTQVVLGLIEHFRNISVAKISNDKDAEELIDAGPDTIARYRQEAGQFTIEQILYIIYTLSNTIDFMRKTSLARIPFEAAMVKLTQIPIIIPVTELLAKIDALQKSAPAAPIRQADPGPKQFNTGPAPVAPSAAPLPPATQSDKPPAQASASIDLEEISGYWSKVVTFIKPRKISVASYMEEGSPVNFESNVITVAFPKECQFHKEVVESLNNKRLIEEALLALTGLELRVVFTLTEPAGGKSRSKAAGAAGAPGEDLSGEGDGAGDDSDPIVKAALNMFSGRIAGNGNGKGASR